MRNSGIKKTRAVLLSLPQKTGLLSLVYIALVFSTLVLFPKPALACVPCDIEYNFLQIPILEAYITKEHQQTRTEVNQHTDDAFKKHEQWMFDVFFKQNLGDAMMMMAEQLSAVAMDQMFILGAFFDAKHQLETERLFQQLAAQAHKDYSPSEGMCSIGTAARSLAWAERNGDLTSFVLSRRSLQRQLMNTNGIGTEGQKTDMKSRTAHFLATYCDRNDNAANLAAVCGQGVTDARKDKDIDFARTLEIPMSLDINFSGGGGKASNDEEDILALKTNLYASEMFKEPITAAYMNEKTDANIEQQASKLQSYMDMRAIVAKRSVAENSFDEIAGMKARGTMDAANTSKYLQAALKDLGAGISDDDAKKIMGNNPSYSAQMEVLTKKLLENPQFYTDLYDKPANVERKRVALQALSVIQERDNYKVALRSEALWSLLLEMKLSEAQGNVENAIRSMVEK